MTAIICIALFLGGFFFPPLWLGLIGYIIYLWKTGKQRRSDIVQNHLEKMVESRKKKATVQNLYFEARKPSRKITADTSFQKIKTPSLAPSSSAESRTRFLS